MCVAESRGASKGCSSGVIFEVENEEGSKASTSYGVGSDVFGTILIEGGVVEAEIQLWKVASKVGFKIGIEFERGGWIVSGAAVWSCQSTAGVERVSGRELEGLGVGVEVIDLSGL